MKYLFSILFVSYIFSCSPTNTISSGEKQDPLDKKQEAKNMDSLLLVRSLPVGISASNPDFAKDIQKLLQDSLKVKKFTCLDHKAVANLFEEKLGDLVGLNDTPKMLEFIQNATKDPKYLNRQVALEKPYLQQIIITPCMEDLNNCVCVKRYNQPNVFKQKKWEFTYTNTESIDRLLSRIIDTLTNSKKSK